ncbi:MAG: RNA polymerase sigma factor [Psychroflexus sp.]|uniref:RNA polymerase sigma factor n=1 Tax=Psychroflexus sp. S27 TaxID=1982757 RepID=UPI000C298EAF|nr:RNA polymerase sigma factor [Psychroflexus sp. S27]PJX28580.1 RNA polymerase subunit sigma-70 [Psychroflexus sp. S27]
MTEKEIIINLQNGTRQEEAFAALVDQHKVRLYWHIRNFVKIHEDTDDVLQNTFVKVYKNIKKFKGESQLYSWMYRIASNESITFLNKKAKKKNISNEELKDYLINSLESDVYFEGDKIQLLLHRAIETLPTKQKEVFMMRYFEEMPYKEMAEILETSEGALKSSYHHASKKVEKFLKNN